MLMPKTLKVGMRKLPKALRIAGEASQRNVTDTLTSRQVDQVIKAAGTDRNRS
jgi:hypothetical protein